MRLHTKLLFVLLAAMLPATVWALDFRSVNVPKAVLFDAPSAQANKRFIVTQYYPLEVIVNLGNWIKVRDASGELAWIEAEQLSEQRTVLVMVDQAEVHASADASSKLVFTAEKDVALELLEPAASGWVKVRHRNGMTGYIKSSEVWGL